MKVIYVFLVCLVVGISCQKAPRYVINGKVSGDAEGMKVTLNRVDYPQSELIDSTVVKDGKFVFEGVVKESERYSIQIDKTKKGEAFSPRNVTNSPFYLENSEIVFTGNIDSLPTMYWSNKPQQQAKITGSAMEDLYQKYLAEGKELRNQLYSLNEKYLKEYHVPAIDGIFNKEIGIKLSREMEKLGQQLDQQKWEFVKNNIQTPVGFDLAKQYFQDMYVRITPEQITELEGLVNKAWPNTAKAEEFNKMAEVGKRIAMGAKYPDIELTNKEGKKVKLSEYVPEGKYVMLEFWASWCGPCRGEIPHLREVYKEYKDKGFEIVSISIDRKDQDWKKAMKEEKMVWTQLNDPGEFEGPVAKIYNVQGVPTCILLDKEGHIFKTDMRGAQLDAVLEELYN